MTTPPSVRPWIGTERLAATVAALAAGAAWIVYLRQGLVLAHYDAKAHLVVARRVLDSLTPGWEQIGAVWLPLPHLIDLVPVQLDLFYRTGASASLVSVVCFGLTAWAAARLVMAVTGSSAGALTSAALLVLNPNLLYLHATPMTEPLSIAATFLAVLWLYGWVAQTSSRENVTPIPAKLGWILFAAAWTRYEAWLVIAAALAAAGYALARLGVPWRQVAVRVATLAAWPLAAVVLFLLHSRATTGAWFVAGGFYELDPYYDGLFWRSLMAVWWGTHRLSGYVVETVALATVAVLAFRGVGRRSDAALLVAIALVAAAALPFYAFYEGHPYRVRYMVPMAAACAVFCGVAIGLARRPTHLAIGGRPGLYGPALALLLIAASIGESPPWDTRAPMLVEAQWDVPRSLDRQRVTACLADGYRGERIFASMASLAHYMQELSREGLGIADFVHEGNGPLWLDGLAEGAARQAGWMLAEEQSEGGDVLTRRIREDPDFARGMTRVCEGGGVALYKRTTETQ